MGGPATETSPPVGLIAAGGVLPFAVADEIVARGQSLAAHVGGGH